MLLCFFLHGAKHGDMTLVDSLLRIAYYKFDGVAHRQSGTSLMEDSGLPCLSPDGRTACGHQANHGESHEHKASTIPVAAQSDGKHPAAFKN